MKKFKIFIRTLVIGLTVSMSLIFGIMAIFEIYENINAIAFGVYKNAFEVTGEGIKILDFFISF